MTLPAPAGRRRSHPPHRALSVHAADELVDEGLAVAPVAAADLAEAVALALEA
eukprot:CAMPEP_0171226168 /NCGR_PEP_ID=MMETSP0790-20130122/37188_1 /TAXON_ID=2925 /ORGANISM="Alexandrium catenella, Strain OF101" /LENGTH=52 /DNA_ID=CAMNT_0011692233 /DNA_START=22 /DNA_END=176 /DNA_ORIENTATION=+